MKKLLTTNLLLFIYLTTQSGVSDLRPLTVEVVKGVSVKRDLFEETVEFIKSHEGFNGGEPYNDNGSIAAGYGTHIKYFDKVPIFPWTKKQADSMLRIRLRKYIRTAKANFDNLVGGQLIAVGHLMFCKGPGKVMRHEVAGEIRLGRIKDLTLLRFAEVDIVKPKYRKNREFELKLFNNL